MDPKRIVTLVVGASVMVLIFSALLVPIIDDATTTEKTFTNEGLWRMKDIAAGDEWTRVANDDAGYDWEYLDEYQTNTSTAANTLLGDTWCIRSNGQCRGESISGNATTISATSDGVQIEITGAGRTTTQDLPGYGIDAKGQYLMKASNVDTYVLEDSVIYGTGQSTVDSIAMIIHVEGNVKDGVTFTMLTNSGGTAVSDAVFTNVKVNATPVDGYKGLYKFTSCTADVTFNTTVDEVTTSHTGSVVYNVIVVPYEVTAELATHPDSATVSMLSVIPIIVMIGIILAVVGVAIVSRNDY